MTELSKTNKLSKEQYALLLYFEQHYWRTGGIPNYQQLVDAGALPKGTSDLDLEAWFDSTTHNPQFNSSLVSRGIPEALLFRPEVEYSPSAAIIERLAPKTISERQLLVANVILDTFDKRSNLKKLTELGVSTREYNLWLQQPAFRRFMLERAENMLAGGQPAAHIALLERVQQGDLGAVRYYNSMMGRFTERAADGSGVNVNIQNNYLGDALVQIVEIIQKHVREPDVLRAIGDDILALQARLTGGGGAVSSSTGSTGSTGTHPLSEVGMIGGGESEFKSRQTIRGDIPGV